MNVRIESNSQFSVASIQYAPNGELCITLSSENMHDESHYQYSACLGDGLAEEKPSVSLMQYAREFATTANIKAKTKDTYRLMRGHLETYGDITIDKATTAYLQGFIGHLQSTIIQYGEMPNSV